MNIHIENLDDNDWRDITEYLSQKFEIFKYIRDDVKHLPLCRVESITFSGKDANTMTYHMRNQDES